jgi:hypothetical protein
MKEHYDEGWDAFLAGHALDYSKSGRWIAGWKACKAKMEAVLETL